MDHSYDDMRDSTPASYPVPSAFRDIDEGFAESQNESENERGNFEDTAASFVSWLQTLKEETRAEIALAVLRTLRTSNIASVVEKLTPLLHMDPIQKLPPEITSQVFSYLDAKTLLTASLASATWRQRILDPRLWQILYKSEGWGMDAKAIREFEKEHASVVRAEFRKARGQMRGSIGKGQPLFKRRATSDWLESKQRQTSADVAQWREQHGTIEADTEDDQEMHDAATPQQSPARPNKRQSQDSGDDMDFDQDSGLLDQHNTMYSTAQLRANMLTEDVSGEIKVNWPYLYKQRHKLEENWAKAKFTNFQLPHRDHAYEAHTECVYTIQFQGKWLVSGSRDKTLRVWDMETRRLRGKPLTGHSQSVLCLQFDPSEEEDVIISGSSDSSVIVWRFSTGQILHVIRSAHEESVLNLRFDKRYLVTCSKDKKIKIWNRNSLSPLDADYPRIVEHSNSRTPSYILDVASMDLSFLETRLANGQIKALQPYTHLMTLEGHQAAVNAIQINGDLVVSASGDRLIRVWNVKTGVCLRVLSGHLKGIACVQFDSKRIVSGSSDNSVRIYDPLTGAEVAVLQGHSNLVRTVQAGFGDAPGSEEEDLRKAKEAEKAYVEDLENGKFVDDRQYLRRLRNGEAGSSRVAFGTTLPPGGGGSKWGRIVSGSYDESIIIWKKDLKGNWVVGQTLKQNEAVRACSGEEVIHDDSLGYATRHSRPGRRSRLDAAVVVNGNDGAQTGAMSASQIVQQAMNASMTGLQNGIQNVMGLTRGLNSNRNVLPRASSAAPPNTPIGALPTAVQNTMNQITSQAQAAALNAVQQAISNGGNGQVNFTYNSSTTHTIRNGESSTINTTIQPIDVNGGLTQVQGTLHLPDGDNVPLQPAPQLTPNQPNQPPHLNGAQVITPHAPAPQNQQQDPQQRQQQNNNNNVSRVFKLQFDARRIVCCSQDSRIVGWDFANGDPEVEAVCEFFVGP